MTDDIEQSDDETSAPKPKFPLKLVVAAVVLTLVIMALIERPPKAIEIDAPTLRTEATAEAYLENLDTLAAYADSLGERKRSHKEFRRIRLVDYHEIKAGAERMAAANPAIREDKAIWEESQKMATSFLDQLKDLDYALTANGL